MIVEKIFQVASMVIMTFGIVGIPIYLLLNARRKRIIKEFNDQNDKTKNDEAKSSDNNE